MSDRWDLRPARDHGLSPGERLRSLGREPGLGGRITAGLWRASVRRYLALAHRLRIDGRENLPSDAPFVLVANHASHLDALVLASALPRSLARNAFALAAGDTFFESGAASVFAAYAINALPIWRGKTTADDLLSLRRRLQEDRAVLILFPEGTRSRTGAIGRFRSGIGALVAGTPTPVVPCFLHGAHAAWPPGRRLPRPAPLRLTIGASLMFDDLSADRAGQQAVAARCGAAVRDLAERNGRSA